LILNLALICSSAILLVLIHPGWNWTFLAPVALTPLLIGCARETDWKRRLLYGEIAGVIYWFALCHWIQFVLAYHGGMGEPGGWGAFALFCLAKAAHMAVYCAIVGPLLRLWYALPAAAALWVGIERTHGPLGFAWLMLGNAGIDMEIPMRLAPRVGVYGLSFLFAMLAAGAAVAILRQPRFRLIPLVVFAGLIGLPPLPPAEEGRETAATVQPNVPQDERWTDEAVTRYTRKSVILALQAVLEPGQNKPVLLLWPESPAPFYFDTDREFRAEAQRLARVAGTYFLFGTVSFTKDSQPLNSAVLLDPKGEQISRYDKMFLVPFGEFIPPGFWFINRITKEAGDFAPGRQVVVSAMGDHKIGAFICYESAFPHLVRQFAEGGAEVLINLTNDGYFGRTIAREQHLMLARMRAAENRRWLLRPTNNGITASIDPAGRLLQTMPQHQDGAGRLRFNWIAEKTMYTRSGDWFAWSCLALGLVTAGTGWRRSLKSRSNKKFES